LPLNILFFYNFEYFILQPTLFHKIAEFWLQYTHVYAIMKKQLTNPGVAQLGSVLEWGFSESKLDYTNKADCKSP
jgi:hypothetical protein